MTFRPPAPKQKTTRRRQHDTRRSIYTNIAFGVAILAAVALLSGVLLGNYYTDHWAPVASVNGSGISKDNVRDRANVDLARYKRQITDYQSLRNQGRISSDEYNAISQSITSSEDLPTLYNAALTALEQDQVVAQYASKNGISISDADVAAQITKDATIPELRHVEIIAAEATPTPPASSPTPQQISDAQTRIAGYLTELKNGSKWDDVYAEATKNGLVAQPGTSSGDLGLRTRDQVSTLDPDLVDAIFALKNANDVTEVFKGDDGVFRIATVTKIVAPYVDSTWQDTVSSDSSGDAFMSEARANALRAAVQKKIEQQYITSPTVMRKVDELYIATSILGTAGNGQEFKFKLMVMAPNHDETQASQLATTDPAWPAALQRAKDAVAKLKADPSQFATMAKDSATNDDQYFASGGGDVPWLPGSVIYDSTGQQSTTLNMPALRTALSYPGLEPGLMDPILEPSVGYLVVDYQGTRPSPEERIAAAQLLIASGTSFADAVSQFSESADATNGGDMGWIARYSLEPDLEKAIFDTPVGSLSRMVSGTNGYWIFKVVDQQTRAGDALEQAKLKKSVWSVWLAEETQAANIWSDSAALTAITPTAAP